MATVGDIILGAREIFPDLTPLGQLPPPIFSSWNSSTGAPGPYPPMGQSYVAVCTYITAWGGETLPSNELPATLPGSNGAFFGAVSDQFNLSSPNQMALGIVAIRVYLGLTSGAESRYVQIPIGPDFGRAPTPNQQNSFIVDKSSLPGYPPTQSSAWLPDTDGQSVSAGTVMRWLNEGLMQASTLCDGIPDMGGVSTVSGQPLYSFPGQWKKILSAWYDGYPLGIGRRTDVFRRNAVTGRSGILAVQQLTNQLVIELWPQPSRTPTPTTIVTAVKPTDTVILLNPASFLLPFGYAKIGTGQNYEIVAYESASGNQLTGCLRGVCGTVPNYWDVNVPVNELNLQFSGHRVPSPNTFGSGLQNFFLPAGWEDAMETYLVARYRKTEQEHKEASELLKEFSAKLSKLMANKSVAGPRQVQIGATGGVDTYPGLGSPFGGVIVP